MVKDQYLPHHYYCNNDYGVYVRVECYNAGQKKCEKCAAPLSYHNPDNTIKWQGEKNILF